MLPGIVPVMTNDLERIDWAPPWGTPTVLQTMCRDGCSVWLQPMQRSGTRRSAPAAPRPESGRTRRRDTPLLPPAGQPHIVRGYFGGPPVRYVLDEDPMSF